MLRENSPLLSRERLSPENASEVLGKLKASVTGLADLFKSDSNSTLGDVLNFIQTSEMTTLDDKILRYLRISEEEDLDGAGDTEFQSISKFLQSKTTELIEYQKYIQGQSPFDTHQGVKGAEFPRVLVVLDDEEGDYNLFSYGKYFGITPLSETDERNISRGEDSVVDRTRRLFYVCCSRALRDLAVVFFTQDATSARETILARGFFPSEDVHDMSDLED